MGGSPFDLLRRCPGGGVGTLEGVPRRWVVPEFANPKVRYLPGVIAPEDVLRLDVAVDDVVVVQGDQPVFGAGSDLARNRASLPNLRQKLLPLLIAHGLEPCPQPR